MSAAPETGSAARFKGLPLKLRAAAASGVGLLVLAYLLAGNLVAPTESRAEVVALEQTGHDLTRIDAFLSNVSVRDASKTDNAAFKIAIDGYAAKLTDTSAILIIDQDRLDATRRGIDFFGWLTPLQNGRVHSQDTTMNHADAALADVARAIAIARTETAFASAYVSAAMNADAGVAAARNHDYAAATGSFQQARNDLSKAELLVKDADVPPQFAPLVDYYGRQMRDLGGLTGAAQANDVVAVVSYLKQLTAEGTALTFDQAGYRGWYSKKIGTIEGDFRKHAGRVPRYAPTSTQLV